MKQELSPVVLFAHRRPLHTLQTIEALAANELADKTKLIVYADAERNEQEKENVKSVLEVVSTAKGFKEVSVVKREANYGLARNIIEGVTEVCESNERVIVLEDDIVTSPHFLVYMNAALEHYQDDERVMQISGHIFPAQFAAVTDAVFLPMTTSWGWATWARAWKHFDAEAKAYAQLKQDAVLRKRFNLDGAYDYFSMLEAQLAGGVDSWAVRWYLSVFMRDGLALFPVKSLVENTGFDGSGTHCGIGKSAVEFTSEFIVKTFPPVVADNAVQQAINRYLIGQRSPISGLRAKLAKWLRPNMSSTI